MKNQKEIWKQVRGYEGIYEISSHGRVKSLRRSIILKPNLAGNGYLGVGLSKECKAKTKHIHKLEAIAFLNHVPCGNNYEVSHIDGNKINNMLYNLKVLPCRTHRVKDIKRGLSKYVGVTWNKQNSKWRSSISINGKKTHLGYFTDELDAANAYQDKLKTL